jgi:hypothetical protein
VLTGLFWGGSLHRSAQISEEGAWQPIPGGSLNILLDAVKQTIISYELAAEGLRNLGGNPLPRESNTDTLQVRCMIDGTPLRHSSSSATTYLVEQRMFFSLSSTFAVNLTADNHTISLQWKKTGTRLEKWVIQTNGANSKFTVTAQADFDAVSYAHETKDEFLYTVDTWKDLSNEVAFSVDRERIVTIGYSFLVQPQLLSFVKDRAMEYVMSRLAIDGTAFLESGETFGTNGWNPTSHVMSGSVRLKLTAGKHTAQLMWRKRGSVFKSWGSSPSSMDGFAASRNIYVLQEKFDAPTFIDHDRQLSPATSQWATVGGAEHVLSFALVKESAVLLTYALPVTQHQNPNFDANVWDPLASLDARLVVDDVAYTFQGGDSIRLGSRQLTSLFGTLALVLPPGSHVAYLQWRSDGFRWMTLNDMDDGFTHGEKLLAYVSSENAAPSITAPEVVYGTEDVVLVITGLRVDDVDALLAGGVVLDVNITVTTGTIDLPNVALLANPVEHIFGTENTTIRLTDTIANINDALLNLTYTSPPNWSGSDAVVISISDLSHTGFSAAALTDDATIRVVIRPVDDMFTLSVTPAQSLPNTGADQQLAPIVLNDIDSANADFRVQLSATCGTLSLDSSRLSGVTFYHGSGTIDAAVDFQASYGAAKALLEAVRYSPSSSCNNAAHQETVTVRVTNSLNPAHDLTRVISIETVRENSAPQIVSRNHPRWSLHGLRVLPTEDTTAAAVTYTQYPSDVITAQDWSATSVVAGNQQEVSAPSELSVFSTPHGLFTLSVRYDPAASAVMTSSNYIQLGVPRTVYLAIPGGVPVNATSALCAFGAEIVAGEVTDSRDAVSCNVSLGAQSSRTVEWLKVIFPDPAEGSALETNYLPLFVSAPLQLVSVYPRTVHPGGRAVLRVQASPLGVVHSCMFNHTRVPAVLDQEHILCRVPSLPDSSAGEVLHFTLASEDQYFTSNVVALTVLSAPTVTTARLVSNNVTGVSLIALDGKWSQDSVDNAASLRCVLNGDRLLEVTSVAAEQMHCGVPPGIPLTPGSTVALKFDEQATNAVVVAMSEIDHAAVSGEVTEIYDVHVAGGVEDTFLTLVGDFKSVVNTSAKECKFGLISTPAVIVDDFTALCAIPAGSSGALSLQGRVIMDDFRAALGVISVPMVTAVEPSSGSVQGGATVAVHGSGFAADEPVTCRFGSALSPGLFLSETDVQCQVPPHAAGPVRVDLIVGSVYSVEAAPVTYAYTVAPVIIAVQPTSGPLAGNTLVDIHVTGLPAQTQDLRCRFGQVSVAANRIADDSVTCLSPEFSQSGFTSLGLMLGTGEEVLADARFLYLGPVVLSGVFPSHGSAAGGDVVVIRGVGFVVGAPSTCVFGEDATPARVINATHLECPVPASRVGGPVELNVMLDGHTAVRTTLTFTYAAAPSAVSISPTFGPPQGGTRVTVAGTGFAGSDDLFCSFGGVVVAAARVSDTELACTAPAHSTGAVAVCVTTTATASAVCKPIGQLTFTFVGTPTAVSIRPAAAPLVGGAIVAVTGMGFTPPATALLEWVVYCQFGESFVIAAVQSDSSLTCLVPPAEDAGVVDFNVVVDGLQGTGAVPVRFRYLDPVAVTSVRPASGSASGGDAVILSGLSFPVTAELECVFGEATAPAVAINDSAVRCITPAGKPERVAVTLSVDGYVVSNDDVTFRFQEAVMVTDISPASGSVYGGTKVAVSGSGFRLGAHLLCLWDDEPTLALFDSADRVLCWSPAHALGAVNLTVIEGGRLSPAQSYKTFTFVSPSTVARLSPGAGPLSGGGTVHLYGEGIGELAHEAPRCVFGNSTTPAHVAGANELTCGVPPTDVPGVVAVYLQLSDGERSNGTNSYRYLPASIVTDVRPRTFATGAASPITVVGSSFPVGTSAECVVGDSRTSARILTDSTAECFVLRNVVGPATVALEIDGYSVPSSSELSVSFVEAAVVTKVDVQSGSTNGGSKVTLTIADAVAGCSVVCLFGEVTATTHLVSDHEVECISPPHAPGPVNITVLVEGVTAEWATTNDFTYSTGLRILGLAPSAGPITGGHQVTAVGEGFSVASVGNIYCKFGATEVKATILSDNVLQCESPAWTSGQPQQVEFSLLSAGQEETRGAFFFRFLSSVQLASISPSRASTKGGDAVLLQGSSIPTSNDLWCQFGDNARTKGTYISSTAVQCVTPAVSAGTVDVSLSTGDFVVSAASLAFTTPPPPPRSVVAPPPRPTRGGPAGVGSPSPLPPRYLRSRPRKAVLVAAMLLRLLEPTSHPMVRCSAGLETWHHLEPLCRTSKCCVTRLHGLQVMWNCWSPSTGLSPRRHVPFGTHSRMRRLCSPRAQRGDRLEAELKCISAAWVWIVTQYLALSAALLRRRPPERQHPPPQSSAQPRTRAAS